MIKISSEMVGSNRVWQQIVSTAPVKKSNLKKVWACLEFLMDEITNTMSFNEAECGGVLYLSVCVSVI